MKVCIFGCKSTTGLLARHIHKQLRLDTVVTIAPEKAENAQVADYCNLAFWCSEHDVKIRYADRYDQKSQLDIEFFQLERFDLGFVNGWQRLLPSEILSTFKTGVFGMHGSASNLPVGRGRSPMNWSLIEGRQVFYTNLFKYSAGVDDGDIVDTAAFSITDHDTAETMHFKNTLSMAAMIERNISNFSSGLFSLNPQGSHTPTYYPKRTPDDSLIDWASPIDVLERFIRAVAPPFNGAFTFYGDHRITIFRAAIFELDSGPFKFQDAAWGEIVEVFPNGKLLVKAPGGLLIVHEFKIEKFDLLPNMVLGTGEMTIRHFPKNSHGGHDLPEEGNV